MIALVLALQVIAGDVLTGVAMNVAITSPTSSPTYDAGASATVGLGGISSSDRGVRQCSYVNSLGGSGSTSGTTSWSVTVALTVGTNVITVSCTDNAGTTGVDIITVTRGDVTAPTVTITSPTSATTYDAGTASTLTTLAGTSSDNVSVSSCSWVSSFGSGGATSGTTSWSVASIPLAVGSNVLTVTCLDPTGNMGSDQLTVTRSSGSGGGTCGSAGCLYVDNSCSTAGNGTVDSCGGATGRMTDLQTALSTAVAGHTVVVHAGTGTYLAPAFGTGYTAEAGFRFTSSGTSLNPITLRNAAGERPILRSCAAGVTTLASCNRPVITAHNLQGIKITSDNCSETPSSPISLGFHVIGLIIFYDDGGATESTLANGSEISCTEGSQGYSYPGDGNWSAVWMQGQTNFKVHHNYWHDMTPSTFSDNGGQASNSCATMFEASHGAWHHNTCSGTVESAQGGGFNCKADCVSMDFYANDVRSGSICIRVENQETAGGPFTVAGSTGSRFFNNLCLSGDGLRGCIRYANGKITDFQFYNNTCVGYASTLEEVDHEAATICQGLSVYNVASVSPVGRHYELSDGQGTECTLSAPTNYNYFTTGQGFKYATVSSYTTLALWKASGPATAGPFDQASTAVSAASFLFTNAAGGIYTLQAGSPLQSAGHVGGVVGGAAVDVGAYTDSVTCLGYTCTN